MKTTARAVKIRNLKQLENHPALFYPEQQQEELFPSALKSIKNTKKQTAHSSYLLIAQSITFGLSVIHRSQDEAFIGYGIFPALHLFFFLNTHTLLQHFHHVMEIHMQKLDSVKFIL